MTAPAPTMCGGSGREAAAARRALGGEMDGVGAVVVVGGWLVVATTVGAGAGAGAAAAAGV